MSSDGGRWPAWSPDGNTVYYWTRDGIGSVATLWAAGVSRGPPFVVTRTDSLLTGVYNPNNWDLHPDGDRFVVTRQVADVVDAESVDSQAAERFLVVVNWFEELCERMGGC